MLTRYSRVCCTTHSVESIDITVRPPTIAPRQSFRLSSALCSACQAKARKRVKTDTLTISAHPNGMLTAMAYRRQCWPSGHGAQDLTRQHHRRPQQLLVSRIWNGICSKCWQVLCVRAMIFTLALMEHRPLYSASESGPHDDSDRQRSDAVLALRALEQLHRRGMVTRQVLLGIQRAAKHNGIS